MKLINCYQNPIKKKILVFIGIVIIVIASSTLLVNWTQIEKKFNHLNDDFPKRLQGALKNSRHLALVTLDVTQVEAQNISNRIDKRPTPTPSPSSKPIPVDRKIFNQENKGKKFGESDQFSVKVNPPKEQTNEFVKVLKDLQIFYSIQVGSPYDYSNISQVVDFSLLSKQLFDSISYELITFPFDQKLQKQLPKIDMKNFSKKDFDDMYNEAKGNTLDIGMQMGSALVISPDNSLFRQVEYYFYNDKYSIGSIKNQLPICVFSTGYKMFSKNKFAQFFKSLQRQNYTNFHIVYIDDNSPQGDVQGILTYMSQNNPRLRNKIKIIHNLQHLGAMGNMYFWINKYCNQDDIVVNIDSDDGLVGTQVFQVLNALYQNPQTWFIYSKYILTQNNHENLSVGFSQALKAKTSQYRNSVYLWDVSHIRTFRYKVFSKIPLQMLIEYHLDQKTNNAYPAFYSFAVDAFQIFTLLQLVGEYRYKFIPDYLYLYFGINANQRNGKCYSQHQKFDDFKSRIKVPMNQLKSLDDHSIQIRDYTPNQNTFAVFKYVYGKYKECRNTR